MHVEVEMILGTGLGNRVCVRCNKDFFNDDLIVNSAMQKLLQYCHSHENGGTFTKELVMMSEGKSWTDSETNLMKMDIIALLEKKGFKIVAATSIDQGREMLMLSS
ncbi:Hypothetical predicted protein [Paramuricea clavata]|uniref:Uncharacterized protein n=1 Tax=Paramuricea clavata TaxID=317549 RepID=A0A7D9L2A6_PARCT|nr:Hypothetical predicted protein [Paramuricea clavata]